MGLIDKCGKAFADNAMITCNRPEGHYGLHRGKVAKDRSCDTWGDNECVPTPQPAGSFTVKVWYWTGAFEEIVGVDHDNAVAYLCEVQDSDRVQAAEIHRADGSLAAGFRRDGTRALDSADSAG